MTAAKLFSSSLPVWWEGPPPVERREKGKRTAPVIHVWGRMATVGTGAVGGRLFTGSGVLLRGGRTLRAQTQACWPPATPSLPWSSGNKRPPQHSFHTEVVRCRWESLKLNRLDIMLTTPLTPSLTQRPESSRIV